MNSTHQVFAYANDVNLVRDNIREMERSAEVLMNASKDIVKINYMEIGNHQRMVANEHNGIGMNFYENVKVLKYSESLNK